MNRPVKLVVPLAFALVAVAGCTPAGPTDSAAASVRPATPPPRALPGDSVYQLPLPLRDQSGRTWDWRARRGRPQLVSMFYTSCPYICPLIIDSALGVEKQLTPAQRGRLGVLLISMDPARDTPAALDAIATRRKLPMQRWSLAAPRPGDVRPVAGVLGIRYRALEDGEFNHSSALVLLDAEGRILARTEQMGPKPDPAFVEQVRGALGH